MAQHLDIAAVSRYSIERHAEGDDHRSASSGWPTARADRLEQILLAAKMVIDGSLVLISQILYTHLIEQLFQVI